MCSDITQVFVVVEIEGNPSYRVERRVKWSSDKSADTYRVFVKGKDKHGVCNADEAMRALGHYLNAATHAAQRKQNDK